MKIPSKIKIGGIIYKVNIINPTEPPLNKNHADGQLNFATCEIFLDKKLDNQMMTQVFLHEILHGIEYNNDMSSSESYIQTMASGLFGVLKDNKLLKE